MDFQAAITADSEPIAAEEADGSFAGKQEM